MRWTILLLVASSTGGCVTAAEFCAVARPLTIETADSLTPTTARQFLAHNRTGERLCGWKPPQPRGSMM